MSRVKLYLERPYGGACVEEVQRLSRRTNMLSPRDMRRRNSLRKYLLEQSAIDTLVSDEDEFEHLCNVMAFCQFRIEKILEHNTNSVPFISIYLKYLNQPELKFA